MLVIYLIFLNFILIDTNSLLDTSVGTINHTEETSTFEQTTNDQLPVNVTMLKFVSTETSTTTTASVYIQNAGISNVTASGRSLNGRAYYNTTSSPSSGGSSLSGGAIAGIVIGFLVLLCCCCICGAKSGHWETRKVWVED